MLLHVLCVLLQELALEEDARREVTLIDVSRVTYDNRRSSDKDRSNVMRSFSPNLPVFVPQKRFFPAVLVAMQVIKTPSS